MRIKIFRTIFAAVNLALISGGLVSCVVEVPQPPAATQQQKPVGQTSQQSKQVKENDKNSDHKNGDRKDNDDKDDND